MLRIAIYTGNAEFSQNIFASAQIAVKYAKINAEVFCARSVESILEKMSSKVNYDVLVLDSHDEDCRKIAGFVRKGNMNASIIFVSASDMDNVLDLIKYRPSKVFTQNAVDEDIAKGILFTIREQIAIRPWFTVKNKESLYRVPYTGIIYFESNQRKVILHSNKQIIEFYGKLNEVIEKLQSGSFIRCHQSYIINAAKVRKFDKAGRCFVMENGEVISRSMSMIR
ncbi:MAG: LytTR family transcriptional regulator DNA-binding domain-containing protein [Acutalibacteraceae bacterium]|nr:LytTR family transcriptional regulator DNA-binding domain-containing protein [Acutalibacteraceae bacterium]